jgi:hemolysin III
MSEIIPGCKAEPKFSLWLFLLVNTLSFIGLCAAVAFLAPAVWSAQFAAGWWAILGVFLVVHLGAAVVEFFFHRYVLHAPLVPFLAYFYKQHTLHHALTRIGYQKGRQASEAIPRLVENRYPIEEEKQYEASYFPWYSLLVFTGVATVFLIPLQILFPAAPIMLGGFIAVLWSLILYETIHAIEHLPQATWDHLVTRPRTGRFWRKAYAFHLRHHADIRCNEAISGFFALPLVDFVFGTYVDPETLYRHGQSAPPEEFVSPSPRFGFLRWLDRRADQSVALRRQRRAAARAEFGL